MGTAFVVTSDSCSAVGFCLFVCVLCCVCKCALPWRCVFTEREVLEERIVRGVTTCLSEKGTETLTVRENYFRYLLTLRVEVSPRLKRASHAKRTIG